MFQGNSHCKERFFGIYKTIDGITSSIIPFYCEEEQIFVLLGQRGQKSETFANVWALVGGFLNPGNESLEQCAARELKEETGLEVSPESMKLVTVQSDPRRDPRGQIIDTVWSTRLSSELPSAGADDLQAVAWYPLSQVLTLTLAFDHQDSLLQFAAIEGYLGKPRSVGLPIHTGIAPSKPCSQAAKRNKGARVAGVEEASQGEGEDEDEVLRPVPRSTGLAADLDQKGDTRHRKRRMLQAPHPDVHSISGHNRAT